MISASSRSFEIPAIERIAISIFAAAWLQASTVTSKVHHYYLWLPALRCQFKSEKLESG